MRISRIGLLIRSWCGAEFADFLAKRAAPADTLAQRSTQNRRVKMRAPDLSGINIVAAGAFNPAIVHPTWLADKALIPKELADFSLRGDAEKPVVVSSQVASFVADWLTVQVTPEQAVFATVDVARHQDLRDVAQGVFDLLPETPVDAMGVNVDAHFRTETPEKWHSFGDYFLPKDFWEPLFESGAWRARADGKKVGMRKSVVEIAREDDDFPGFVRVELAPSVRVQPHGIYVGINSHLQLTRDGKRSNAAEAVRALVKNWDSIRQNQIELQDALSKSMYG